MNEKKYATTAFLLVIVTAMPLASAQHSMISSQNHLFFASVEMSGYNVTGFPLGGFFINHTGVCAFLRIWTSVDGHIELSKIGNPSSNIVLDGNQTITLIGFAGYAILGGNCSSGHCDPMDVHGKALLVTW